MEELSFDGTDLTGVETRDESAQARVGLVNKLVESFKGRGKPQAQPATPHKVQDGLAKEMLSGVENGQHAMECLPTTTTHLAQLFASGELNDLKGDPRILSPERRIKREKYRHRLVAYGLAEGIDYSLIAQKTGYSTHHICTLAGQEWMQALVLTIQNTMGFDALNQMLREAAAGSIQTLISIRDDVNAPYSVRSSNAKELLEKVMGKSNQPLTLRSGEVLKDPISEMAQIDAQLAQLEVIPAAKRANAAEVPVT